MRPPRPSLNEKTAAIAYARAFNTHDLSLFAPLCHRRLHVTDQRHWAPSVGADRYLQIMQDYFDHVPVEQSNTRMELAETSPPSFIGDPPRPCVVEHRRGKPVATFLFGVRGGLIRRIEKRLLPPPTDCRLTGIYPGLGMGFEGEVN